MKKGREKVITKTLIKLTQIIETIHFFIRFYIVVYAQLLFS